MRHAGQGVQQLKKTQPQLFNITDSLQVALTIPTYTFQLHVRTYIHTYIQTTLNHYVTNQQNINSRA